MVLTYETACIFTAYVSSQKEGLGFEIYVTVILRIVGSNKPKSCTFRGYRRG